MTQYLTKFEAGRNGAFYQDDAADAPAGWTLRYGATGLQVRVPSPAGDAATRRFGWSSRSSVYQETVGAATWDMIDADAGRANVEVLSGVRPLIIYSSPTIVFVTVPQIIVRADASVETFYRFSLNMTGPPLTYLNLESVTAGVSTVLGAGATLPYVAGEVYWMRLRVNGSTLQARAWARDDAEPSGWMLSVTDTSISAAGSVGRGSGVFDFFSVGTNGDAAAKPRSLPAADAELCRAITSGQPVLCALDFDVPAFTGSTSVAGRVTRKFSNHPYDTGAVRPMHGSVYDARIDKIPSVSREISEIAGGVAKVSGCDVVLPNGDGALDDLFRMALYRSPASVRIGLPAWPWYDLLPYHQGVIQGVVHSGNDCVVQIDGPLRELDADVTLTTSVSGANIDKPLPQQYGQSGNTAPVLVDATTNLVYQYNDGANRHIEEVRDRGISLASPATLTITAFDAAADTLTTSAAHGRAVGDLLAIYGTPPAPLVAGALYEIKTVPAVDKFTLSATRGGTLIDLTGTSGAVTASALVRLWFGGITAETGIVSPTGTITMARQAVGQITIDLRELPARTLGLFSYSTKANFVRVLGIGGARFDIGYASNNTLGLQNLYLTERRSRLSVLEGMAARGIPVTASRGGALSWRAVDFATVAATLTEADCYAAPRLTTLLQPSGGRVGLPNWTVQSPTDLASTVSPADIAKWGKPQLGLVVALGVDQQYPLYWGGLSADPTLYRDTPADQSIGGISDTVTTTGAGNGGYTTLNSAAGRARAAQVFELSVATKSFLLDPVDVISLTHRRHFFKDVVNEIDVSPERPATAIGAQNQPSRAVITKIVDDPAHSRQTLTLYRPMPVLFPAS